MSEDRPEVMRKESSETENRLHRGTIMWLKSLPSTVKLNALIEDYPRILNRVAALWINPPVCQRYLDELLFNDRSDKRQGFPPKVCLEIMNLKGLLVDLHESAQGEADSQMPDVWKNA